MAIRTGPQQPHINKAVIDGSPIVIPQQDVLDGYYKVAESILDQIMAKAFETQQLASLRDWLLPMLMNGQVTVK